MQVPAEIQVDFAWSVAAQAVLSLSGDFPRYTEFLRNHASTAANYLDGFKPSAKLAAVFRAQNWIPENLRKFVIGFAY
jgi:hypothetical protein